MVFAFLSDAKPLTSYRNEPRRSAQGWATISPQNVSSWGRSYKQSTYSELKLPLFIWRGLNIVTCTARIKQASGPPAPAETPQREPGVRCCSIVGGMAPEPRAETTLSSPAQSSPGSNSLPTHPLLPLWGWRTKRGFCRFRRPFFISLSGSRVIIAVASSYFCEEEHLHQASPVIMTSFFLELARHCCMTLRRWIQRGP